MIPRRLVFIWLGYHLPEYAVFSIAAFQKMNPDFEVKLINRNVSQFEKIYASSINSLDEDDQLIKECIQFIIDKQIQTPYRDYIEHQRRIYAKDFHIVNILSDLLRIAFLNKYGGIYLDCDCFPVKKFDDQLLKLEYFVVDRHYSSNMQHGLDNYFIGACKQTQDKMLNGIFDKKCIHLMQTVPNWHSNTKFIYNKHLFFNCKLQFGSWSLSKDFYIDHYNNNSWSSSTKSTLPTSVLDDFC